MGNKNTDLFSSFDIEELNEIEEEKDMLDKEIVLERNNFHIAKDKDIELYLKEQTFKLHNTVSKAYTKIGNIFLETQEKLAGNNQYNGMFEKWYSAIGFSKVNVYRLINRSKMINSLENETTKKIFESLPITLSYEISNPNCSEDLKNKVLEGHIKTLKEFQEYKNNLINDNKTNELNLNFDIFEKMNIFASMKEKINSKLENLDEYKKIKLYQIIEEFEKKIEKILIK